MTGQYTECLHSKTAAILYGRESGGCDVQITFNKEVV